MQKWAYFSMGAMAGIIVILVFMLLSQHHDQMAWASTASATRGDAQKLETMIRVGGSQQQLNDMVWVLHRRDNEGASGGGDTSDSVVGDVKMTLAVYKVGQGSKAKMQLMSVRDITYDVEVPEYNITAPSVREIKKKLEEASKKKK